MGGTGSKLEKALGTDFPDNERYFGLENFGNTCYVNSVVQSLYHCQPFRKQLLENCSSMIDENATTDTSNMLASLTDLFVTLNGQKKRTGMVSPRKFVQQLRHENEIFRSAMHQDAQEFLNFLLNTIVEILHKKKVDKTTPNTPIINGAQKKQEIKTFVHDIFEGIMTNEMRCICCENVTSREESFLDLSVDVSQNSSLTHCLRNFSSVETLRGNNKFYCDRCNSLQEAQKSIKIKKLPKILAIQLKRFKYSEEIQTNKKLSYRVSFPFEMKFGNTSSDCVSDPDTLYELFAVVIHVGNGPNHGHYKAVIKSNDRWLMFDDDQVELVNDKYVQSIFGYPGEFNGVSETAYILFYRDVNTNVGSSDVEDSDATLPTAEKA